MKHRLPQLLGILLLGGLCTADLRAQTPAFNYQGALNADGSPASGTYDLEFRLFDAASNGSQVGPTLLADDLAVNDGLFSIDLDFGLEVFDGGARWLEIGVRPGTSSEDFTTLTPRQPITSAPYSLRSLQAMTVPDGAITGTMLAAGAVSQLGTPNGLNPSALLVDAGGRVGLGTNDPGAGLHITASRTILNLEHFSDFVGEDGGPADLDGAWSVAAEGNLLAVATPLFPGRFTLLDLANKSSPAFLSQTRDGDDGFTHLNGAQGLAFSGSLLAVAAFIDSAVTLVDVTNPLAPALHATLLDGVDGFNELGGAISVAIQGNLLAVAAREDDAVTLVDVSNPSSPILRATMKAGSFGFDHLHRASFVVFSGNLLAIGADVPGSVTLVDVSNPSTPALLSVMQQDVGGFQRISNVSSLAIEGDLLAIASRSRDAVTLVNIANPAAPVLLSVIEDGVAGFSNLNFIEGVALSGDRLAITSVVDDAVTLVDVGDPAHPRLLGYGMRHLAGLRDIAPKGVIFHDGDLIVASGDFFVAGSGAVSILQPVARNVGLASSHWVGIGTAHPVAPLHVEGNVTVHDADEVNFDTRHFSAGEDANASGYDGSIALGRSTTASGSGSTALGFGTKATGASATAMGQVTTASGLASTALGATTVASGLGSLAAGVGSQAHGDYSVAAGHEARAEHAGTFVWSDSRRSSFTSTSTNQFLIEAQHGVGINTTSPANSLSVAGDTDITGRVSIGISGADARLLVRATAGEDAFRVRVNTATKLVVKENGGVGIGANFSSLPDDGLRTAGAVGIGADPGSFTLVSNGNAAKPGGGLWSVFSDARLKDDIRPLASGTLDRFLSLRGCTFEYLDDAVEHRLGLPGRQTGLIAQEVAKVFPEWVEADDEGYLYVTPRGTTAITVEALRELRAEKDAEIAELKRSVAELTKLVTRMTERMPPTAPDTTPDRPLTAP